MAMKKKGTALVWVRNDFRIDENQALIEASEYEYVLPVFIHDVKKEWPPGEASCWWLHHSLVEYQDSLQKQGSNLFIMEGQGQHVFSDIFEKIDIQAVFWNRNYDPSSKNQVKEAIKEFEKRDIPWTACAGSLLKEPADLLKSDGSPYLVYTPFWRNFLKKYRSFPKNKKRGLSPSPEGVAQSLRVESLKLLPTIPWDTGFFIWKPGEKNAKKALKNFIQSGIESYHDKRDFPAVSGTSSLSPYLHFGEIHPRSILDAVEKEYGPLSRIKNENIIQFCKEIVWREFAYHLLYFFPLLPDEPLKKQFKDFPWKKNANWFDLWCSGNTGYPIVDAGMRELWNTGWMHNRVRMIVASFLIKHLNIPWQEGARWFWNTLVDADLASNTQGWQWTAGCGPDASPFFRIFNPITQGEKFDQSGDYIRKWCPELSKIPLKWIHKPWELTTLELANYGVTLGCDYPRPIVDHKTARAKALERYKLLPKSNT
ncbi:MAG: deoxyribodipyrimidine photo-lyase [Oligoflexales bacterium]